MTTFKNAWGYQGDAMDLPVADVDASAAFYVEKMGFEITDRGDEPVRSVTLRRPDIEMRIAENGGDPAQDGVAFEVDDIESLYSEFTSNGINISGIKPEKSHGADWKVFFVVAPDGLCYWLGERRST